MKYYKIKLNSQISFEKRKSITDRDIEMLSSIGLEYSHEHDPELDEAITSLMSKRKRYLSYSKRDGFYLSSAQTANVFSEENLNTDELLKGFLEDKEYELIETDGDNRVMRYKRE